MTTITAAMVKDLREMTGAGMMDCKNALKENDGDIEAAIDWLRTKGLAKAAKKSGRVAAEGLIGIAVGDRKAALIEVNSETDFVARNEKFQEMVRNIAAVALDTDGDFDRLTASPYPGSSKSIGEFITEMVATIGENMSLRRSAGIAVPQGAVATYVHNAVADGLGKIGVMVALESTADPNALATIGKQLAMHVAAASPLAVDAEDIDPAIVEREKAIFTEQARESGKPENIVEKMVQGRVRKFLQESALMQQAFIMDTDKTVAEVVKDVAGELGAEIRVAGFVRFALGEGIERDEGDFAAEVAAAAGQG